MARKPKMTVCRNCGAEIAKKASICPKCGLKNKKPIFKRFWFILLVFLVVFGAYGKINELKGDGEAFVWSDIELSEQIPVPASNVGTIYSDTEKNLRMNVNRTDEDEYREYIEACKSAGFTIESEKNGYRYTAYNGAGYKLNLSYYEKDKEMNISLEAPMQMMNIQWPESDIVSLLPKPESAVGKIMWERTDGFSVYVGDTDKDAYDAYVNACADEGFNVDYDKGDTYYYAYNEDGYYLAVKYEGNCVISVKIDAPEEEEPEETIGEENEEETDETTPSVKKTERDDNEIRPEFKTAIDSYEAFVNDYCDFMIEYEKNPTDLGLLAKMPGMLADLAEMEKAFAAWEDDDLSNAELTYYIEVQGRVTKKLVDVAY